jgi:hypothetical protein
MQTSGSHPMCCQDLYVNRLSGDFGVLLKSENPYSEAMAFRPPCPQEEPGTLKIFKAQVPLLDLTLGRGWTLGFSTPLQVILTRTLSLRTLDRHSVLLSVSFLLWDPGCSSPAQLTPQPSSAEDSAAQRTQVQNAPLSLSAIHLRMLRFFLLAACSQEG